MSKKRSVESPDPGMLHGVRILDLTHFLAGPFATMTLADLGANVIKLENPDRPDEARSVGPYMQQGQSLYFTALNSGKRSLAVRFGSESTSDVIARLVRHVDVVVDNYRPGVMGRLGLDHATLAAINPSIITCSLTGFGETGPRSTSPAYDYTVQALTGVMSMTGEEAGPPGKAGVSYVDHSGGLVAGLAICAALVERARSGRGRHLDVSLHDVQISMLSYLASWHLNSGYVPTRLDRGAHPSLVPAQNFEVLDGWVSVFVGNDGMWRRFAGAFPGAGLDAEEFQTSGGRNTHREQVVALIDQVLGTLSKADCVEMLAAAGVPCAPINNLHEALADPHVAARGLVREFVTAPYGTYRSVTGPLPAVGQQCAVPAPVMGQDTRAVLQEIGFSGDEIAALAQRGVIYEAGESGAIESGGEIDV
ncbi:CoA transferase [Nocardioides sp. cx-169]|uniref:CaiB/BaiF CoA transferase family protein n=1 Tax=Nocardioides sp. cx-169 TaxID=2899080 RepID=UPI001E595A46|nr:CoA transferase [Nocardioides sp. cx-169]MCD4536483.1 CoA transferase [Nocardioides sp. cx-169]